MDLILKTARGEIPADLLLKNGKIINVFTGEILENNIAISAGKIAGIGDYVAKDVIDINGQYIAPGLIDSHVHIESSLVTPPEFSRAVVPRGTTTVITDPHEIANVLGLEGIRFMIEAAKQIPLTVYINAPSCVPSSPMETTGAVLGAKDLAELIDEPSVLGLAEVMNFPGVINGDEKIHQILKTFAGKVIDGHCPGLTGKDLNAYVAAGIGSDHECTSVEEALEKLRLGMYIFIREATNARNLKALLPVITPGNARRICFCSDDRQPEDLLEEGHIDFMLRTAIRFGVDPVTAIRMATLNPAEYYNLHDRGSISPGCVADLIVFPDLNDPVIDLVFKNGQLVAQNGDLLPWDFASMKPQISSTMNLPVEKINFRVEIPSYAKKFKVIEAIPDQLITNLLLKDISPNTSELIPDPSQDILKIAVVDRHSGQGKTGIGFVQGIGLKAGAIASTVAHDHHNIVVIGVDDKSMLTAVETIVNSEGGMVAVNGDQVLAHLRLPIAGLMSELSIERAQAKMKKLLQASHELGSTRHDPFMAMSFLALPVIPSLKITDYGLVDVDKFEITELFA